MIEEEEMTAEMDIATQLYLIQPSDNEKKFVRLRKQRIDGLSKQVFSDRSPRVISLPISYDPVTGVHQGTPLLLRLNTIGTQMLDNIELFMKQASFQESQMDPATAEDMVACGTDLPTFGNTDTFPDEYMESRPEHSYVFVLGSAGSGKTRLLDEIVLREIRFFHVRVVQLDFATWSQMEPREALLHLATQIKLAFNEDRTFNEVLRLQLRSNSTNETLCEQMLNVVQNFCQHMGELINQQLKVLFVIDNYKFPVVASASREQCLAQRFMQMVDKYKQDFYVVAAVADPQGLPVNANIYELRNGMRRTEVEAFISGILVPSRNNALVSLFGNSRIDVIRIVRQYTKLNPHEMDMLFKYVHNNYGFNSAQTMHLRDFAHLARQFVQSGNEPRYPLRLGHLETTLQDVASRYDSPSDTVESIKETVLRAYFNLQAEITLDSTREVFQQSALDHHPFICSEFLKQNSSGLQFSSPRVAEYVVDRVFGSHTNLLLEAGRMLGLSDHERYEMAYIASRWLCKMQRGGLPVFGHNCINTLYRLNECNSEKICQEISWLGRNYGNILGNGVASTMTYSQASHQLALSHTNGLDFIYQLCNGEDAAQYVVLAMVQSDGVMRDIINAWKTRTFNDDGQEKNVKLTPFKRVLAGIQQATKVHSKLPGNQSKKPFRLHLLGTRSATVNLDTCELPDASGRSFVTIVDISSLRGLNNLNILQFR